MSDRSAFEDGEELKRRWRPITSSEIVEWTGNYDVVSDVNQLRHADAIWAIPVTSWTSSMTSFYYKQRSPFDVFDIEWTRNYFRLRYVWYLVLCGDTKCVMLLIRPSIKSGITQLSFAEDSNWWNLMSIKRFTLQHFLKLRWPEISTKAWNIHYINT